MNRDAKKSVESAKLKDTSSGGNIKYFNFISNEHNILHNDVHDFVNSELKERGKVMKIKENTIIDIKDCNDPIIMQHVENIANGTMAMEAPCEYPISWSDEERKKLKDVLSKYYPK